VLNAYDSRNAAFGPYDNVGGGDQGGGWQGSPSAEWSDSTDMGVG
jgi:hypothetical protein